MWILFAVILAIGGLLETAYVNTSHYVATATKARAYDDATSLGVIAQAVDTYRRANPSVTGKVPATSLPVPAWYHPPATAGVVFSGGFAYVYLAADTQQRAGRLAATLTDRGFVAGIATSGSLRAPGGASVATAPTTLPAGSVAIVQ